MRGRFSLEGFLVISRSGKSANHFCFVVAVLTILTGPGHAAWAQATRADLPPDAAELIGRRASCLEWSNKLSNNRERAAQIEDVMRSLRCGDVPGDELVLRQKYKSEPNVIAALDATWSKAVQRLPIRPDPSVSPLTPSR
jgi:hypothetical protein